MQHIGGNLVDGHHFENWGKPEDHLLTKTFRVNRNGCFQIRAEFSNGSGPVNTGITCAVKKLLVLRSDTKDVVASGYLIMPQSGDWRRWDLSSPVTANLSVGVDYSIRLMEDEYSRNMSYLQKNERYTAWPGGDDKGYNYANIAAFRVMPIADGLSFSRPELSQSNDTSNRSAKSPVH